MLAAELQDEPLISNINGYVSDGRLNEAVVEALKDRGVPETFISTYLSAVPLATRDIDVISDWWVSYLQPHASMASVATYLGNVREKLSWFSQFNEFVPKFVIEQT